MQVSLKTICDKAISSDAKILLIRMLAQPNDWRFSVAWLAKELGWGVEKVRKFLKELELNGYVKSRKMHNARGKFAGYSFSIYEVPEPEFWGNDT